MILGISGPNELSAIERCPYYRGFRKKRLDCSLYSKSREQRFTNSVIKKSDDRTRIGANQRYFNILQPQFHLILT